MGLVRSRRLETLVARNRKRHPRENCPQHTATASVGVMLIFAVAHSFYHFPLTCPIFSSCRQIDWLILSDDRTIPPLHQAFKLGVERDSWNGATSGVGPFNSRQGPPIGCACWPARSGRRWAAMPYTWNSHRPISCRQQPPKLPLRPANTPFASPSICFLPISRSTTICLFSAS